MSGIRSWIEIAPPLGLSQGSFSTFHIRASASVIRRSKRCARTGRADSVPVSVSVSAIAGSFRVGRGQLSVPGRRSASSEGSPR
jgi:hypothetical protein